MDWFKKHTDAVIILGGILGAVIWMNGEFNEVKKELTVIKTVMIMKGMMPDSLATQPTLE